MDFYFNKTNFLLYYMKLIEQWCDVTFMGGGSLKECLKGIEELPHFQLM